MAQEQDKERAQPVAGHCRFKGEKEWRWCSAEHVTMVLADPRYAAEGYEVRYLYAAPQPNAALADGWVAVPREATEEMKVAAVKCANGTAVYKNVGAAVLRIEEGICGEVYEAMLSAAPERPAQGADGYADAFYELASLMGMTAQNMPPAEVWRQQMLPRLRAAIDAPPTLNASKEPERSSHREPESGPACSCCFSTECNGECMENL